MLQAADGHADQPPRTTLKPRRPSRTFSYTGIFFSIYFAMTGVHALHILAGMGVIAWLLVRSVRGDFTSHYFGPRRLCRPVLAPGRPGLDLSVPAALSDSLTSCRSDKWKTK
jgi:hypothetical protein